MVFINIMINAIVHSNEQEQNVDVILASYSPNNAQTSHWKLCLSQINMEGFKYTTVGRILITNSVLKLLDLPYST